ncbi:alpha/beta hydrolase [Aureimonas sp. AU20]|uniref:alpha/beta hydrolase n=1 Tax=Aureimonas sp. AU20 TaxID=1349819 RepID=UPI000785F9D0|nr:alpha/beta hydrolase-fold protein [Aureimonas sp. AU20]
MTSLATQSEGRSFSVPQTQFFDLGSSEAEPWRVFVHVPPGEAPAGGWPLLVITDGNAMMATAVDALRVQSSYPMGTNVGPGVIAAIGYPTDDAYDPLRRSFDLSPPPGQSYPPFFEGGPQVLTGGSQRFLDFIEGEALPFLDGLARIDPARRTLFGHSFGGLFALHALFSGCEAFSRYVAASPTIYWEGAGLLDSERRFATEHREKDIVIHLSVGEYEGDALAPFQYGREDTEKRLSNARTARTLELTREMAARLSTLPRTRVCCEIYSGETHMTMLPIAVSRAIRMAFEIDAV